MPTLALTPKGVLHLHASLREALGLCHGQAINLIPPTYGSVFWHLDLRKSAPSRVLWYNDQRMRAHGILLPPGLVTETLTLYLLPGEPAYERYYPVLPSNAFSAPFYAHLAE